MRKHKSALFKHLFIIIIIVIIVAIQNKQLTSEVLQAQQICWEGNTRWTHWPERNIYQ